MAKQAVFQLLGRHQGFAAAVCKSGDIKEFRGYWQATQVLPLATPSLQRCESLLVPPAILLRSLLPSPIVQVEGAVWREPLCVELLQGCDTDRVEMVNSDITWFADVSSPPKMYR